MSKVICNKCKRANKNGAKYCKKCGNKLILPLIEQFKKKCYKCGFISNITELYCPSCGVLKSNYKTDRKYDIFLINNGICPKCRKTFSGKFCANCGLFISNVKYKTIYFLLSFILSIAILVEFFYGCFVVFTIPPYGYGRPIIETLKSSYLYIGTFIFISPIFSGMLLINGFSSKKAKLYIYLLLTTLWVIIDMFFIIYFVK